MLHRTNGFSLVEVLIASVILSMLAAAALATMRSTSGFTVTAGRQTEGVARSMEWLEGMRNQVHPDNHLDGMGAGPAPVTMTNVSAMRQRTVTPDPFPSAAPSSKLHQMKEVKLHVLWDEPR